MDKDVLQTYQKTGITFSFWGKMHVGSRFIEIHSFKNGFRFSRGGDKLNFNLYADTFRYSCSRPLTSDQAKSWNHIALSLRIKPSPKVTCYLNGIPAKGTRYGKSETGMGCYFLDMGFHRLIGFKRAAKFIYLGSILSIVKSN